jgi:hypothetical protein
MPSSAEPPSTESKSTAEPDAAAGGNDAGRPESAPEPTVAAAHGLTRDGAPLGDAPQRRPAKFNLLGSSSAILMQRCGRSVFDARWCWAVLHYKSRVMRQQLRQRHRFVRVVLRYGSSRLASRLPKGVNCNERGRRPCAASCLVLCTLWWRCCHFSTFARGD